MGMTITDWDEVPLFRNPGETGFALWRTRQFGEIRVRMVEYSPGYLAGHWCHKGHVILCFSGSIDIELADGAQLRLTARAELLRWRWRARSSRFHRGGRKAIYCGLTRIN